MTCANKRPIDCESLGIDFSEIPEHMRDGLRLYIDRGLPPGSFLMAVLTNDLAGAFGKADLINQSKIKDYVSFLYNHAPRQCWGSVEKVDEWIKRCGLYGKGE